MRFAQFGTISSALLLASALPATASPKVHRGPTSPRVFKERASTPRPKAAAVRAIDSQRATQIQTALISSGYLTGTPSGAWDDKTQAAMEKLQADNGWQTKLVPDARAIIKLGLGPKSGSVSALASSTAETSEAPAVATESKQ